MYSKIHSRLNWFFQYIGEPEEDFEVDLYGDVNFDGTLNVTDVITLINFVLGQTPTEEESLTADMNQDTIVNILDVILVVNEILGTTFAQSVQWLEENFPELKTKERLSKLDKSQFFAKTDNCVKLRAKYEKLLIEHENLKMKHRLLKKLEIETHSFNSSLLWEPWDILKDGKTNYKVFTPYFRRGCLNATEPRRPLEKPKNIKAEILRKSLNPSRYISPEIIVKIKIICIFHIFKNIYPSHKSYFRWIKSVYISY